jgi:hypothetical protein
MATRRRVLKARAGANVVASSFLSVCAHTQGNYPDRPIRMIMPFPPGGPIDTMARLVAEEVTASVGKVVAAAPRSGQSWRLRRPQTLFAALRFVRFACRDRRDLVPETRTGVTLLGGHVLLRLQARDQPCGISPGNGREIIFR